MHRLTRRSALSGAAALLAARPALGANAPIDLHSPRGDGYAYVKLHADVSGRTAGFNGLSGVVYAVVGDDGPITRLFGVESFSIGRAEPQADGAFRYLLTSTTLITDPDTGAPLTQWRNPMTGQTVKVSHTHFPSVCWIIGAEPTATTVGGTGRPTVWTVTGDLAVYTGHNSRLSGAPPRRSRTAEFVKVFASLAELQDQARTTAPYTGVWNSMTDWEPWMAMGDAPGHLFQSSTLRRLEGPDAIDPRVRAAALARWPACLTPVKDWRPGRITAPDPLG